MFGERKGKIYIFSIFLHLGAIQNYYHFEPPPMIGINSGPPLNPQTCSERKISFCRIHALTLDMGRHIKWFWGQIWPGGYSSFFTYKKVGRLDRQIPELGQNSRIWRSNLWVLSIFECIIPITGAMSLNRLKNNDAFHLSGVKNDPKTHFQG